MPRLTSCVQPQRMLGYIAGSGTATPAIWGVQMAQQKVSVG